MNILHFEYEGAKVTIESDSYEKIEKIRNSIIKDADVVYTSVTPKPKFK